MPKSHATQEPQVGQTHCLFHNNLTFFIINYCLDEGHLAEILTLIIAHDLYKNSLLNFQAAYV